MKARILALQFVAAAAASTPGAAAADGAPSKDGYWLFRPTPRAEMRELSTDRPDTTESPHTVDAGHAQVELEAISVTWDRDAAGAERRHASLATVNAKLGLANRVDLQVVARPLEREDVRLAGTDRTSTQLGPGDIDLRLKVNLWGNDGGPTAFAVMPFVTLPAGGARGAGGVEGGLILPLGLELPAGFEVGLMLQGKLVRAPDGGYEAELLGSATTSHALVGEISGFAELVGSAPVTRPGDVAASANFGLMYAVGESYQLDAGANVGLTERADDLRVFVGASARF